LGSEQRSSKGGTTDLYQPNNEKSISDGDSQDRSYKIDPFVKYEGPIPERLPVVVEQDHRTYFLRNRATGITKKYKVPVPEGVKHPVGLACNSDISARINKLNDLSRSIREFPYYATVCDGLLEVKSRTASIPAGRRKNQGMKVRGEIKGRSRKSSIRQMKYLAKSTPVSLWIDQTLADDVVRDLSEEDRCKEMTIIRKRYNERIRRMTSKGRIKGRNMWTKEIKDRKSGELKGQLVPHLHNLLQFPEGTTETEMFNEFVIRQQAWVMSTGTKDPAALKVALHEKSWRFIKNKKQAIVYVSKYTTKEGKKGHELLTGRCWGICKNWKIQKSRVMRLTGQEHTIFRRVLVGLLKTSERVKREKMKGNGIKRGPGASYSSRVSQTRMSYFAFQSGGFIDKVLNYAVGTVSDMNIGN
jgi:hypothetical protein